MYNYDFPFESLFPFFIQKIVIYFVLCDSCFGPWLAKAIENDLLINNKCILYTYKSYHLYKCYKVNSWGSDQSYTENN